MRALVAISLGASVLLACGCGAPQGEGAREPLRVTIEEVGFGDGEREVTREAVAESVARRAQAEHTALPAAEVDGAPDPDAWPRVTVANETAHGLVVWVSGPCARTIALPPRSQNEVEVCAGSYQVAGQVAEGNFLPLVGDPEELENGYHYTFTFYVQTNPYVRQRRPR
jgi:hypothetical protein